MKRDLIMLAATLSLAGCAPGYTNAEFVYAEPVEYEYVVPVDRVVVVTRDVLITRGWTVYRVQRSGPNRIIWARRGDDRADLRGSAWRAWRACRGARPLGTARASEARRPR